MTNYKGFFRSQFEDILYEVRIISDDKNPNYVEVNMGSEPFKVTYETSNTLFEPVRKSRATIQIVHDEYMLDTFSPYPNGTKVQLLKHNQDETTSIEWCGYLKPNMYDQSYQNCFEVFDLEASDCLSLLQYYTYKTEKKEVVTFATVLNKLMDKMDCLYGYYFPQTKKIGDKTLMLGDLTISEQNFFSSDTDEAWTLDEVLEEICKYLGVTCIEYKNMLYFIDYQWLAAGNQTIPMGYYSRKPGGSISYWGTVTMGEAFIINNDAYMANGASISMDTIYNKAVVNCSIYDIEEFIPNIMDDENLHNRYGDWTKCQYVPAYGKKQYINRKGDDKYENTDDQYQIFVHRILDNDNYSSIYYNPNSMKQVTLGTTKVRVTHDYGDETGMSYGGSVHNDDSVAHTVEVVVISEVRWDGAYENLPYDEDSDSGSWKEVVEAGASVSWQAQAWATIDPEAPSTVWVNRNYSIYYLVDGVQMNIGDDERGDLYEDKKYVGGTIVDLASYEKLPINTYNYEPTPNLSFSRYLCINQMNKPNGDDWGMNYNPATGWYYTTVDLTKHPAVFALNKGFTRPVVWGNGTYISINCKALATRYLQANYINKKWTDEVTGMNSGIFSRDKSVGTRTLALVFKLGIGKYFWNGNAWTTENTSFMVPMSTAIDDNSKTEQNENEIDFDKMWNTDFHVLNNFSWEEWTGSEGYRIPIDNKLVDPNGEVTFEVHLPVKIQYFHTNNNTKQRIADSSLNGYVWISDLEINVDNVGKNKDKDDDIVYENIIDDDSINELEEIDLKINTNPDRGPLSYSFVGLKDGGYLKTITEPALSNVPQKPEENIIEKLVSQYSTPTKKETLTLKYNGANPYSFYEDMYWAMEGEPYVFAQLGTEIDYAMDRQTMTIIELKGADGDISTYLDVTPETVYLDDDGSKKVGNIQIKTNTDWTINDIEL